MGLAANYFSARSLHPSRNFLLHSPLNRGGRCGDGQWGGGDGGGDGALPVQARLAESEPGGGGLECDDLRGGCLEKGTTPEGDRFHFL